MIVKEIQTDVLVTADKIIAAGARQWVFQWCDLIGEKLLAVQGGDWYVAPRGYLLPSVLK
jgi:hypothetical protein